jgi:hypothetical protein
LVGVSREFAHRKDAFPWLLDVLVDNSGLSGHCSPGSSGIADVFVSRMLFCFVLVGACSWVQSREEFLAILRVVKVYCSSNITFLLFAGNWPACGFAGLLRVELVLDPRDS